MIQRSNKVQYFTGISMRIWGEVTIQNPRYGYTLNARLREIVIKGRPIILK